MTPLSDGNPGQLFLVVGPSGAGKDSLIEAAKSALVDKPGFVFPRRIITRPSDPGSEVHDSVAEAEFDRLRDAGAFFLHWGAHGLRYGLPASITDDLAAGATVICNVSRQILTQAHTKHRRTTVILVTASQEVLEQRLMARGREDLDAIRRRLSHTAPLPDTLPLVTVSNDGSLEQAVAAFLSVLTGPAGP